MKRFLLNVLCIISVLTLATTYASRADDKQAGKGGGL